jgi:hypothetical protein
MKEVSVCIPITRRESEQFEFTSPTKLGKFLQENPDAYVCDQELAWVKQVIQNIENGYDYLKLAK